MAKDAEERPAGSVCGLEHVVLKSRAAMMGLLPDNGFCYFKEPALSERGDGIQFTAGFFQPLPFQQPALGPWSWQVSREQMLRKIGSFTKCLQILPAGPLPILPPSPLRENMHVCPQPLSSGSFLMGLVLKACGGGLCRDLCPPHYPIHKEKCHLHSLDGEVEAATSTIGCKAHPWLKAF